MDADAGNCENRTQKSVPAGYGNGKSREARARQKLARLRQQISGGKQSCQVSSAEDYGTPIDSPLQAKPDIKGPQQPCIRQPLFEPGPGSATAETITRSHGDGRLYDQHANNSVRILWFAGSLLLVLFGARWGSEMSVMNRLERLDAKVQHLQAQQEVAHCLPSEEDVSDHARDQQLLDVHSGKTPQSSLRFHEASKDLSQPVKLLPPGAFAHFTSEEKSPAHVAEIESAQQLLERSQSVGPRSRADSRDESTDADSSIEKHGEHARVEARTRTSLADLNGEEYELVPPQLLVKPLSSRKPEHHSQSSKQPRQQKQTPHGYRWRNIFSRRRVQPMLKSYHQKQPFDESQLEIKTDPQIAVDQGDDGGSRHPLSDGRGLKEGFLERNSQTRSDTSQADALSSLHVFSPQLAAGRENLRHPEPVVDIAVLSTSKQFAGRTLTNIWISHPSNVDLSVRIGAHHATAAAQTDSLASWQLQWGSDAHIQRSAPGRGSPEAEADAKMQDFGASPFNLSQYGCEGLWRLPWSQNEQDQCSSMCRSRVPSAAQGPCTQAVLSAHAWPDVQDPDMGTDASQLVDIVRPTLQSQAASPFGPCLAAASPACEKVIQSDSLFPADTPWQLSWANQSRTYSLVHHLLQDIGSATSTVVDAHPVALWRLPWAAGTLASDMDESERLKDYVKALRKQEMSYTRANWQLVWIQ